MGSSFKLAQIILIEDYQSKILHNLSHLIVGYAVLTATHVVQASESETSLQDQEN